MTKLGKWGILPFGILWTIGMYFSFKIEKTQKQYNIKTYKEIIAFTEGNSNLDELRKQRNHKKYFIEKTLFIFASALIGFILAATIGFLTDFLINL